MSKYTKGQQFLLDNISKFDSEIVREIQTGKIKFSEGDFYLRASIKGSSNITELVRETNERVVGIQNFDKDYLPNKENLALEKIKFSYATTTQASGITDVRNVKTWTAKMGDIPAALLNGEFYIMQEGSTLLRIPVKRFFVGDISPKTEAQEDAFLLNAIQLIKSRTPLDINIEFAGAMDNTDNHFVEIRLIGDKTTVR